MSGPLGRGAPPASQDATPYVPRRATEDALATLTSLLRVGATRIALRGPAGIGKTTLLKVARERLAGRIRAVRMPDPAIPPESVADHVLARLGEPEGGDAERRLVALARELREQGSGLAVLVDAAERMPLPTARRLSRLAAEARPALSLVFALSDAPEAEALLAALDSPLEEVPLRRAMSLPETRAYLAARCARSAASGAAQPSFNDAEIEAIQRQSGGIPGEVERVARERAEATVAPLPAPDLAPGALPAAPPEEPPRYAPPPPDPRDAAGRSEPELDAPREAAAADTRRRPARAAAGFAAVAAALAALLLLARSPDPDSESGLEPPSAVAPDADQTAPQAGVAAPQTPVAAPAPIASAGPEEQPVPDRSAVTPSEASTTAPTGATGAAILGTTPAPPPEPALAAASTPTIPVSINAAPWARIEVDGEAAGFTPLADLLLTVGPHAFRAVFPDGRVVERTEEISALHRRVLFR